MGFRGGGVKTQQGEEYFGSYYVCTSCKAR